MARWHIVRDFKRSEFRHAGRTKAVFRKGNGPGVIVMPELPGPHPQVLEFARHVARAGFTVVVPELIGRMGRPATPGYMARSWVQMCVSREFRVLASHRSSPIVDWLRALCRALHEELGGAGVGAVGMCLSGNFALAMMMEPSLLAAVLSQPSLPLPISRSRQGALHLSPAEVDNLKQRAARGDCALALRFSEDPFVPPERFEALRAIMKDRLETIQIDSENARPAPSPLGPHSVLAGDLIDEEGHPTLVARDRVISFLRERLQDRWTGGPSRL